MRGKDDLTCIPHLPFNMIPSATVLYTREKLGRTLLRKAARVSNFLINPPHSVVTPSGIGEREGGGEKGIKC